MMDAESIPEAVQWHEGMMLVPQHFQQQAIRNDALLSYHIRAASPFHWGVRRLVIDPVLLIEGLFRVLDIEAVLPDGLIMVHRDEDVSRLETDLTLHLDLLKQRPMTVHLAVPALRPGSAEVKGYLPRYDSIEGKPVVDENTGDDAVSVPRLRPRLSLQVTETPSQKYCTIPIARILYKNEAYGMTDFIPPTLAVTPRSTLWEICMAISQRIREKAVFLSEKVSAQDSPIKGPKAIDAKLQIQNLVCALPPFEAVLHVGVSHPFTAYLALASLVGCMAGLTLGTVPPVLAAYNHNDLKESFEQAKRFIFRMIEEGILESHTAIPFDFENGVFSLKLKKDWMAPHLIIGIQTRPGTTERDMIRWMEECLIGAESSVESMREKRILGARRTRIDSDGELVPVGGMMLYSVTASLDFIKPDQKLTILNTSDVAAKRGPIEITLYVRHGV